ncbi:MAG TPA: aldo/keto reductase, partial [Candidatus Cybelea sp.]|nr:aldo/keto reductase [Candidatus Cybelea sp.]
SRFDFSPSAIVASVERSLKRLRTDRIDVLLLHSDGEDETLARFGPAIDALERLKQAGKLIATGFSGKTVEGGLMGVAHTDVVMITLNPGATADRAVAAAARQAGKGVLVKKALDSGNLVSSGDPVRQAMELIFAEPGVSCVVIGTLSAEHLAHDVAAARQAIERAGHGG